MTSHIASPGLFNVYVSEELIQADIRWKVGQWELLRNSLLPMQILVPQEDLSTPDIHPL